MLLLLIFPVLVAGFFACHIHPIHAYKLHRYEGQYLYLKSASLEVSFKTFYEDIDAEIYLSLRQYAILSVTEFNFDAYKAWNTAGDKRVG